MQENNTTIEIDIKRVFFVLLRNIWIIILVGALLGAAAFSYAWFFIAPTYSASTRLYVNNTYGENNPGFSSSQLAAAQNLANTYIVILQSRYVLDEVKEVTQLDYTASQLKNMVSAETVNNTEVFQVNVTCTNYKHAAIIANAVAKVLPDKIEAIVDGSSVRVVDWAAENPNPVGPDYQNYAMMGVAVGMVISAVLIVVVELTDTTICSEEYLTNKYSKIPLLAVVPSADGAKTGSVYKGYYEQTEEKASSGKGGKGK